MIMDENLEFADAVAIPTGGAATALVGDVIDLGAVNRDIGQGKPLYLVIQVDTVIAGGTAVQWVLASDSVEAINAAGDASQHALTDVFLVADLVAGFQIVIPLPMGDTGATASITPYERYLGILVTGTGTQTSGNFDAFLTLDPAGWRSYPDAANS